ncbi:MAG: hypothetical protein ABH814_03620 [bacterium]
MKNFSILYITILAIAVSFAALVLSNPLIISATALVFVAAGFYSHSFTFAFLSGLIYSLCSQAGGVLGPGLFSAFLITENLIFLKIKETIRPGLTINLLCGGVLLLGAHMIFFRQLFSVSYAVALLVFLLLNVIFVRKL